MAPVRKNQKILTAEEPLDFVAAVKLSKKDISRLSPPTLGPYDDYVYIR
ncbi:MAG: hypothetical protein ABSG16_22440 [Candidatus Acidiferrum sp.]|jgi:hypothetical protein